MKNAVKSKKAYMNKIRYILNYRILPIYGLISAICLILALIFMEIDEVRFLPVFIGLLSIIGIMTAALILSMPFVRKIEVKAEMARYDFDTSSLEPKESYSFTEEDISFYFDKNGMYVQDQFYGYELLKVSVSTSHYANRIWISVLFYIHDTECYETLLDSNVLHMIQLFHIKLSNQELLDYIVHHKEEAFDRIYRKGRI